MRLHRASQLAAHFDASGFSCKSGVEPNGRHCAYSRLLCLTREESFLLEECAYVLLSALPAAALDHKAFLYLFRRAVVWEWMDHLIPPPRQMWRIVVARYTGKEPSETKQTIEGAAWVIRWLLERSGVWLCIWVHNSCAGWLGIWWGSFPNQHIVIRAQRSAK